MIEVCRLKWRNEYLYSSWSSKSANWCRILLREISYPYKTPTVVWGMIETGCSHPNYTAHPVHFCSPMMICPLLCVPMLIVYDFNHPFSGKYDANMICFWHLYSLGMYQIIASLIYLIFFSQLYVCHLPNISYLRNDQCVLRAANLGCKKG